MSKRKETRGGAREGAGRKVRGLDTTVIAFRVLTANVNISRQLIRELIKEKKLNEIVNKNQKVT